MKQTRTARVMVLGDSASDVCVIEASKPNGTPSEARKHRGPRDCAFVVPGGAAFVREALQQVLNPAEVEVIVPRGTAEGTNPCERQRISIRDFPSHRKGGDHGKSVWRVARRTTEQWSTAESAPALETIGQLSENDASPPDLLVIADSRGTWRQCTTANRLLADTLENMALDSHSLTPRIFVDLDRDLPACDWRKPPGNSGQEPALEIDPELLAWKTLERHKEHVCIMVSARRLRHEEAALSRHLSWELCVETLGAELRLLDRLRMLSRFGHLIVRFGCVAAAHIFPQDPRAMNSPLTGQLIFAPRAKDGVHRDRVEEGDVVGYKSLITAALIQRLLPKIRQRDELGGSSTLSTLDFANAIRTGLLGGIKMFDAGYDVSSLGRPQEPQGVTLLSQSFGVATETIHNGYENLQEDQAKSEHVFGIAPIPTSTLNQPESTEAYLGVSYRQSPRWEILRESLNNVGQSDGSAVGHFPSARSMSYRINAALAVVLYGHQELLNRESLLHDDIKSVFEETADPFPNHKDPHDCVTLKEGVLPEIPSRVTERVSGQTWHKLYTPVLQFGKLVLVEREEIESLRSVRNLIRSYAQRNARGRTSQRPMSIAVFGPPGSGKSFAVKQIQESVNNSLSSASRRLAEIEFNCSQFRTVDDLVESATRISNLNHQGFTPLVFFDEFDSAFGKAPLGWLRFFLAPMQDGFLHGTHDRIRLGPAVFVFCGGTAERFERFLSQNDPESFRACKGPDFVSRLSAHVNILPISRNEGEYKPVLRRAMLIRSFLEQLDYVVTTDGLKIAAIDEDVLYALLTVDRYRHGVRSLETIINMCTPIDGRIEKASLPAHDQLDMHVNADEFSIRMYRGRLRRSAPTRIPERTEYTANKDLFRAPLAVSPINALTKPA